MINNVKQAEQFLFSRIPQKIYPGGIGIKRTRQLLKLLGNPQERIKVIHIAGTSGKGSTSFFISQLLFSQGFSTGLHLSPHILDIRERFLINNKLISSEKFVRYLNRIIIEVRKMEESGMGFPTYFEILCCLAFFIFYKEKVDYAIMETGVGGTLDATNTVDREDKISVITRIGMDHIRVLGNTLAKIASHKAGIINKNSLVITIKQLNSPMKVIQDTARARRSRLLVIDKKTMKNIDESIDGIIFDYIGKQLKLERLRILLNGRYQAENLSLALSVLENVSERDRFNISEDRIRKVLDKINIPARFDKLKIKNKTLIIDGAHNFQKMSNFLKSLRILFPSQKFTFIIAFKKGKDYRSMLKLISVIANKIILTRFFVKNHDIAHISEESKNIVRILEDLKFTNFTFEENTDKALKDVLSTKDEIIVATGSLYLMSDLYRSLEKYR